MPGLLNRYSPDARCDRAMVGLLPRRGRPTLTRRAPEMLPQPATVVSFCPPQSAEPQLRAETRLLKVSMYTYQRDQSIEETNVLLTIDSTVIIDNL